MDKTLSKFVFDRRDKLAVMNDILVACLNMQVSFTQLMYRSNLCHHNFKAYTDILVRYGFLSSVSVGGRVSFIATDKGKLLVKQYRDLLRLFQ